jgi:hypothetical protein
MPAPPVLAPPVPALEHCPATQAPPVHTLPQEPQLAGSVEVSVQLPAQSVWPALQVHDPFTQTKPAEQA